MTDSRTQALADQSNTITGPDVALRIGHLDVRVVDHLLHLLEERRRGSTGTGQPEAGVAIEPNIGFGSDRPRRQGPWMALLP